MQIGGGAPTDTNGPSQPMPARNAADALRHQRAARPLRLPGCRGGSQTQPGTDGWDYAARYGVATLGRELLERGAGFDEAETVLGSHSMREVCAGTGTHVVVAQLVGVCYSFRLAFPHTFPVYFAA